MGAIRANAEALTQIQCIRAIGSWLKWFASSELAESRILKAA